MRIARCLVAFLFALMIAVPVAAQQPTPAPKHDDCIIPDQAVIDWISQGLYPDDGTYLRHVWAVKSGDFENVWFVAADLEGPELDGNRDIAIWATNALTEDGKPQPGGGGFVWSNSGFAKEFSDWPTGQVSTSEDYDGRDDAEDCAKGSEQLEPTPTPV